MEGEEYMNRKSRKQTRAEVEVEVSILIIILHTTRDTSRGVEQGRAHLRI